MDSRYNLRSRNVGANVSSNARSAKSGVRPTNAVKRPKLHDPKGRAPATESSNLPKPGVYSGTKAILKPTVESARPREKRELNVISDRASTLKANNLTENEAPPTRTLKNHNSQDSLDNDEKNALSSAADRQPVQKRVTFLSPQKSDMADPSAHSVESPSDDASQDGPVRTVFGKIAGVSGAARRAVVRKPPPPPIQEEFNNEALKDILGSEDTTDLDGKSMRPQLGNPRRVTVSAPRRMTTTTRRHGFGREEFNNASLNDILGSDSSGQLDSRMGQGPGTRLTMHGGAFRRSTLRIEDADIQTKRQSIYAGAVRVIRKKPLPPPAKLEIKPARPEIARHLPTKAAETALRPGPAEPVNVRSLPRPYFNERIPKPGILPNTGAVDASSKLLAMASSVTICAPHPEQMQPAQETFQSVVNQDPPTTPTTDVASPIPTPKPATEALRARRVVATPTNPASVKRAQTPLQQSQQRARSISRVIAESLGFTPGKGQARSYDELIRTPRSLGGLSLRQKLEAERDGIIINAKEGRTSEAEAVEKDDDDTPTSPVPRKKVALMKPTIAISVPSDSPSVAVLDRSVQHVQRPTDAAEEHVFTVECKENRSFAEPPLGFRMPTHPAGQGSRSPSHSPAPAGGDHHSALQCVVEQEKATITMDVTIPSAEAAGSENDSDSVQVNDDQLEHVEGNSLGIDCSNPTVSLPTDRANEEIADLDRILDSRNTAVCINEPSSVVENSACDAQEPTNRPHGDSTGTQAAFNATEVQCTIDLPESAADWHAMDDGTSQVLASGTSEVDDAAVFEHGITVPTETNTSIRAEMMMPAYQSVRDDHAAVPTTPLEKTTPEEGTSCGVYHDGTATMVEAEDPLSAITAEVQTMDEMAGQVLGYSAGSAIDGVTTEAVSDSDAGNFALSRDEPSVSPPYGDGSAENDITNATTVAPSASDDATTKLIQCAETVEACDAAADVREEPACLVEQEGQEPIHEVQQQAAVLAPHFTHTVAPEAALSESPLHEGAATTESANKPDIAINDECFATRSDLETDGDSLDPVISSYGYIGEILNEIIERVHHSLDERVEDPLDSVAVATVDPLPSTDSTSFDSGSVEPFGLDHQVPQVAGSLPDPMVVPGGLTDISEPTEKPQLNSTQSNDLLVSDAQDVWQPVNSMSQASLMQEGSSMGAGDHEVIAPDTVVSARASTQPDSASDTLTGMMITGVDISNLSSMEPDQSSRSPLNEDRFAAINMDFDSNIEKASDKSEATVSVFDEDIACSSIEAVDKTTEPNITTSEQCELPNSPIADLRKKDSEDTTQTSIEPGSCADDHVEEVANDEFGHPGHRSDAATPFEQGLIRRDISEDTTNSYCDLDLEDLNNVDDILGDFDMSIPLPSKTGMISVFTWERNAVPTT
ncbi:hypothetical protein BC832DRAFT_591204 [Gaertneriomyces semiglobifer]|nr:hypothetical protein BC832DRAFT_591204 [Gaertneriomyces semiglobifer]